MTVIRVTIALVQGDYSRTLELAHQALAHLSDDQLLLRALTNMSLGSAYTGLGDLNAASQTSPRSSALYQAAGHMSMALAPLRQLAQSADRARPPEPGWNRPPSRRYGSRPSGGSAHRWWATPT